MDFDDGIDVMKERADELAHHAPEVLNTVLMLGVGILMGAVIGWIFFGVIL